jgi:Tetracyclin repressor-like, C-terminal domain
MSATEASILSQRRECQAGLRAAIETGIPDGCFGVCSAQLTSYAVLDIDMGVSAWYRSDAELSES